MSPPGETPRALWLLEAGGETHPLSRVPMSYGMFIDRPGVNWRFASKPDPQMGARPIPVPRGRMLGGSSAINGLVFVRGQALDYDSWAQMGNRGWSYADVLPLFRRMESYEDGGDDTYRGGGGPPRRPCGDAPRATWPLPGRACG